MTSQDAAQTGAGRGLRLTLFAIFTLSGFAGLIYEAVWGRYLKLFLGHSAYAQTFVIAIFMGGMAIGSWISSRRSTRWSSLLRGYAYAEIAIGVFALFFQPLFEGAMATSFESIIPALGAPFAVELYKQSLSIALILPPSILLGMTFPLMSGGVIRLFPEISGSSLSFLYFTNSIGAAAGVIVTGFVLVDLLGLPGTVLLAGVLNILIGLFVWLLSRTIVESPLAEEAPLGHEQAEPIAEGPSPRLLFTVAALTGFASFLYEIGWIRMLSLVLGSSTHAFELMLGTFIAGLALGGYWIKGRIDALESPVRYLAYLQWIMGFLALGTLALYNMSFDWMVNLINGLNRSPEGYVLFNIGSNLIAVAIMLPAAFCAGTTLPLITFSLLKRGYGEQGIGAVYSANTVGGILGVFVATHLAMPLLGLKGLVIFGAIVDIGLGVILFAIAAGSFKSRAALVATGLGAIMIIGAATQIQFDPLRMASGVYRYAKTYDLDKYTSLYHADGKTSSIDVLRAGKDQIIISTNGKPDASLRLNPDSRPTTDESTQSMLGAIPLAARPDAKEVAIIGLGSGMTSHVMLASPAIERLDTVEIEAKMVEGARYFSPRNDRVYTDPRSQIIVDDARTYFSANQATYDIIVSEPSNPWVSGVASLFTREFYGQIKRHLKPGGILAQWVQLYELAPELLASIMTALDESFPHYTLFAVDGSNLAILASVDGPIGPLSPKVFEYPDLKAEMSKYRVTDLNTLELHRLGDKALLRSLFRSYGSPPNSDFFPYLDARATESRFLNASSNAFVAIGDAPLPIQELLGGQRYDRGWLERPDETKTDTQYSRLRKLGQAHIARSIAKKLLGQPAGPSPDKIPAVFASAVQRVHDMLTKCDPTQQLPPDSYKALYTLGSGLNHPLDRQSASAVWQHLERTPCFQQLDERSRNWFEVLKAAAARDAAALAKPASTLLATKGREQGASHRFLVEALMISHMNAGNPAAAQKVWQAAASELPAKTEPSISQRLLLAKLAELQQRSRPAPQ